MASGTEILWRIFEIQTFFCNIAFPLSSVWGHKIQVVFFFSTCITVCWYLVPRKTTRLLARISELSCRPQRGGVQTPSVGSAGRSRWGLSKARTFVVSALLPCSEAKSTRKTMGGRVVLLVIRYYDTCTNAIKYCNTPHPPPNLGDRWWPQTAKQERDMIGKTFYVLYGKKK